ncbi:hypothetical protein TEA_006350 [Camellia sinensis var. sinensis]|uniref:Protein kinase domain-containing protein n=1 Tax=Camellia sinensis var. sinensis TaxID=542762 RepID=A0A4S4DL43_CAMSN|nr:hypothetical protein TEA_006350 [Camellia sinensis var. sinensis]
MSGLDGEDAISSVVIESEASCHCFSLVEIELTMANFNEELVLGVGGFGKVYKGLPNIKDVSGLSVDNAISSVVIESEYSCRCFSLAEIQSMTDNFNEELVIRIGRFGKVYKGFIDNGATTVAIKRLNAESNQGTEEF